MYHGPINYSVSVCFAPLSLWNLHRPIVSMDILPGQRHVPSLFTRHWNSKIKKLFSYISLQEKGKVIMADPRKDRERPCEPCFPVHGQYDVCCYIVMGGFWIFGFILLCVYFSAADIPYLQTRHFKQGTCEVIEATM